MIFIDIIGVIGLLLILIAFALNIWKKIKRDTCAYNLMNVIGASLLAYYSIVLGATVLFVLQVAWALIALYFLIRRINKRKGWSQWGSKKSFWR